MKLSHALSSLLLLLATSVVLAKTQKLPEVSEDGLHLLPDSKMAIVYAEPGADLAQYQRVRLLDAYVAFKKNWARNQRSNSAIPLRVTSADMEKIKKTLAEEFDGVFREALEKGGYKVVDENADDVL
ncbi:MAG: hypothetical protein OES53_10805, partial [Xanthomonadales bacterium]|nr:hypothetical protein [Xanthomonadales bacterium]